MLRVNHIKETCLYVQNLEASKQFYHDKLGFPLIGLVEHRHVFFRVGSTVLLCFIAESTKNDERLPPHFGYGKLHFAFEVPTDQYKVWKNKITSLKIPIEQEVTWQPNRKSFYFRDPDNHCVEIVMPGIWE